MRYYVTCPATNVLGDTIEDRTLSTSRNGRTDWAASFENYMDILYFESQETAFFGLVEFLNCCEKYFYDSESGNIFRMLDVNEIALQGFKIKGIKDEQI